MNHIGFFFARTCPLDKKTSNAAQEIAKATIAFQRECTGVVPASVTVLLGEKTLVVTLHDALSPAEKLLARSAAGAARVEEYHRQLFRNSATALHKELQRILGVEVHESSMEIEPGTGRVVEVLPSGNLVQVFRLAQAVEPLSWSTPGVSGSSTSDDRLEQ
jgi:uncharacterized protein YbcI